jgi:hypothetical protein
MTHSPQQARHRDGHLTLCLGAHHLLTGATPTTADTLVLADLNRQARPDPPNTIILDWASTTATTLDAVTADGTHRHSTTADPGTPIYQAFGPAPAITRLYQQHTGRVQGDLVPLFCLTKHARGIHVYSRIRLHTEDACFLRTTVEPLPGPADDLHWLPTAIAHHERHAQFLNSHTAAFQQAFPGREIEYKYTLDPTVNIWAAATALHRQVETDPPPGYVPEYRDSFQMWDYHNHLFETFGGSHQLGYVSFVPTSDGTYIIKRKTFPSDSHNRGEHHTHGVTINSTLADHLSDALGLTGRPLPPFRRVRYDVNLESLSSGHLYAFLLDRVTLLANPDIALIQCELEYRRSRTVLPPHQEAVLTELNQLGAWLEQFLARESINTSRGHYSKLSFLRDALASHPHLAPSLRPASQALDDP